MNKREQIKNQIKTNRIAYRELIEREIELKNQLNEETIPIVAYEIRGIDGWSIVNIVSHGRILIERYGIPKPFVSLLQDIDSTSDDIWISDSERLYFNLDDDYLSLACDVDNPLANFAVQNSISLLEQEIESVAARNQAKINLLRGANNE